MPSLGLVTAPSGAHADHEQERLSEDLAQATLSAGCRNGSNLPSVQYGNPAFDSADSPASSRPPMMASILGNNSNYDLDVSTHDDYGIDEEDEGVDYSTALGVHQLPAILSARAASANAAAVPASSGALTSPAESTSSARATFTPLERPKNRAWTALYNSPAWAASVRVEGGLHSGPSSMGCDASAGNDNA
jgi:hypothetical protein